MLARYKESKRKEMLHDFIATASARSKDGSCPESEIESLYRAMQDNTVISTETSVSEILADGFEHLFDDYKATSSGYPSLDNLISGFTKNQLHILAARPGVGKSTIALNFAKHMSVNTKVVMFSLEMTKAEIILRLLVLISGVNRRKIRSKVLTDDELNRVKLAQTFISENLDIVIYDITDDISKIQKITSKIQKHGKDEKDCIFIVDYLQLITGSRHVNKVNEVGDYSRSLKLAAVNGAVICLSQLSRAADGVRPMLSHLRDSGSIEQDADCVHFLHSTANGDAVEDITYIIAKARDEKQGEFEVRFDKARYLFRDEYGDIV